MSTPTVSFMRESLLSNEFSSNIYLTQPLLHVNAIRFSAFADLVVGTLYHSFQTNPNGFEDRLLDLLAAGGTRDFAEALQPFGLDPKSPR